MLSGRTWLVKGLASEEQRAVLASEEAAVVTEREASELASGAVVRRQRGKAHLRVLAFA